MKMLNNYHIPVLLNEVINNLNIVSNGTYVDCTAGFGGHSQAIIDRLKDGKIICFEQDSEAYDFLREKFKNKKNVKIINENFTFIDREIKEKVNGIVFDLGVSNYQLTCQKRGFSYKIDGPLDMRMNQKNKLTAATIINTYPKEQLIAIFKNYGEVKKPQKIVDEIIKIRKQKPIITTLQLQKIICNKIKNPIRRKHPAKTYFQALRIAVNDELNSLKQGLKKAINLLKKRGILAVITFHSLEDRIVKQFFKDVSTPHDFYSHDVPLYQKIKPNYCLITKKPITPTIEEIEKNHKSHSAKLRVLQKIC